MRAAVIGADASFSVETLDDPTPGPGELVLRVTGCGICGSDLKARPAMPAGTVMGHELCGEVVAVGPAPPTRWREGMRAAVLPVFSCGDCAWCRAGDVAHCAEASLMGLGGCAGGFAELVRGARRASRSALPDDLPAQYGPLVEPFAVGLHTARIAGIAPGDDVLVIGAGPVGLTTAWWARDLGARHGDGVRPGRAAPHDRPRFGATATVDPTAGRARRPLRRGDRVRREARPARRLPPRRRARTAGWWSAGVCAEPDPFLPLVALLKELTVRFSVYYRPDEFRAVVDAFADGPARPGTPRHPYGGPRRPRRRLRRRSPPRRPTSRSSSIPPCTLRPSVPRRTRDHSRRHPDPPGRPRGHRPVRPARRRAPPPRHGHHVDADAWTRRRPTR